MGASFKDITSINTDIHIGKVIPDPDSSSIDWNNRATSNATTLQMWNGQSYVGGTFYWTGEVPLDDQDDLKYEYDLDQSFVYNNIWVDGYLRPADVSFPAGTAFWITDNARKSFTSASVTIYGEVLTNDDATIPTKTPYKLSMLANTLPIKININEIIPTKFATINWDNRATSSATSVQFWNGSSYVGGTFYWTGEVPPDDQDDLKYEYGLAPSFEYNNIWVDGYLRPVEDLFIGIGQGFWISNPIADNDSSVEFPGL